MVLWVGLVPWWSTTTEKLWLLEIRANETKQVFMALFIPGNANDFL